MVFSENFRVALRALRANKMRSILTTLGIIIGVAAVIAVVSIVQGLQFMITKEFQGVGATFVLVDPDFGFGPAAMSRQVRLTWEDGKAIRDRVAGVRVITPVVIGQQTTKYRDRQHKPNLIFGTNEHWPDIANHAVEQGRFFSSFDLRHRRKVAVVGVRVVEELQLGLEPVGKEIYVGSLPVTVIGVLEKRGQSLGQDSDDVVFVPFDTALTLFGRHAADTVLLRLQAESTGEVHQVKDEITQLLRQRHKIPKGERNDFRVQVQDELLESIGTVLLYVTGIFGGVVGIALLVGGIGIMNIMLVSVTERTREIGVRKAVGARRQDLLVQFLIEAVMLSLIGGGIGLIAGWGLGAGVAAILPGDWPPAHVPLWAVLLAVGFSVFVGVVFGVYPAGKASRLDPIDALRYE